MVLVQLEDKQINRYARQISLKKIGAVGQKKLLKSKVLIVGAGGLGSPISMYLTAAGIGNLGIIDGDTVDISNLHRQILFKTSDIKKKKASTAAQKLKTMNPSIKIISYNKKLNKKNIYKIAKGFDVIVDGSDNFETRYLINDFCYNNQKILVSGAVSKFDGHIYTFNFKRDTPCLRCFMPNVNQNEVMDCESDGIIGTLTGVIGSIQANEVIKEILDIGQSLCGYILIINTLNLSFRKVKLYKNSECKKKSKCIYNV